jgi:hypothetical protein
MTLVDEIQVAGAYTLDAVLPIALRPGPALTGEEVDYALGAVGRNAGPALLFDLYYSRRLAPSVLAAVLVGAWSGAEFPGRTLPRSTWIAWFREAAYPTPAGPVILYRGAIPRHARGMSWTPDRERADWFANRWTLGRPEYPAHVYTVTADPAAILADVDALEGEGGRQEHEIIVDPAKLPPVRRVRPR